MVNGFAFVKSPEEGWVKTHVKRTAEPVISPLIYKPGWYKTLIDDIQVLRSTDLDPQNQVTPTKIPKGTKIEIKK
eukprot:UN03185